MPTPARDATHDLRLLEDTLPAGGRLNFPPDAVNRVLYVVPGAITIGGGTLGDDQAWQGRGEAMVVAGPSGATVWRYELAPAGGAPVSVADGAGRILVNHAGIYSSLVPTPFEQQTVEQWRQVLDVNVIGTVLATRAVTPLMRARGGGRVINLSSGTPFKGVPFLLHDVASKGAVNAITKALAKELGPANILVNGIAPGVTLSDGVKANPVQLDTLQDVSLQARVLKRDQVPDDLVGAVLFLAGPGSAFVTGQTLVVDGGVYFH